MTPSQSKALCRSRTSASCRTELTRTSWLGVNCISFDRRPLTIWKWQLCTIKTKFCFTVELYGSIEGARRQQLRMRSTGFVYSPTSQRSDTNIFQPLLYITSCGRLSRETQQRKLFLILFICLRHTLPALHVRRVKSFGFARSFRNGRTTSYRHQE